MSGLLNSYEEDYRESMRTLSATLELLKESLERQRAHEADPSVDYYPPPATGASSRSQQLQSIMEIFSHVKDLIASMNYEVNDLNDTSARADAKAMVDGCRKNVVALDKEVSTLRRAVTTAERTDLLSFGDRAQDGPAGVLAEADDGTKTQRMMALQTSEKMQTGTNTLLKAEAYLAQTNNMGRDSLGVLRGQTEQMQNIRDITADVDGEISASRQIIHQMQRTAIKHKLWLWGIIILLVLFMLLLFYLH